MRVVSDFPHRIRRIENCWIPVNGNLHLAARIWLPEDAEEQPVPAILEYIPYRKRDSTRARDDVMHGYLAGHGYACLRVDMRGSGDSEGILEDEYLPYELEDGVAVIEWISQQPWCDGSVGMIGISWGGFNGLQIAALQPSPLKAIITVCSSYDRYANDVHHMGGCLLGDNLSWASTMFAYNSLPPDPEIVGERWREMWLQRLEASSPWIETWLRHQRRDEYWQHGSVCEDWAAIRCPVLAVSGWADGYSNTVFRLLQYLQSPRLGLIGPWSHKYPHQGVPGPTIGFLQECLRWWDQWLKGEETGIMQEPMLRAWMQYSVPPTTYYQERPGRWIGEPGWPSANVTSREFVLSWPSTLEESRTQPISRIISVSSPLSVGLFAGKWCSYAATPDLPHDQREEDGGALVFTSHPLAEPMEIIGPARVELTIAADQPVAMIAVRLSDVAYDDKATRVTYGLLNLTHRDSHSQPTPLEPGRTYLVNLEMNDVAHAFPAGHRIRLSVSTSYWPLAWPPPKPVRLSLRTAESRLLLPVRSSVRDVDQLIGFPDAEGAPATAIRQLTGTEHNWRVIRDLAKDESMLEVVNDNGTVHFEEIDLQMQRKSIERYRYVGDDFNSVRGETLWERGFGRGDWQVKTVARTRLSSTSTAFVIHAELDAYEGDRRIFARNWDLEIPRDLL